MLTFRTEIRGAHFRGDDAKNIVALMSPGEAVALEPEPENPYDENAIRVLTGDDTHIGYIAKEDAASIMPYLDQGLRAVCRITGHASIHKPTCVVVVHDEDEDPQEVFAELFPEGPEAA